MSWLNSKIQALWKKWGWKGLLAYGAYKVIQAIILAAIYFWSSIVELVNRLLQTNF